MFSKKIVAAAALLAVAAGAQAQVKLYGHVDMSVGSYKSYDGESTFSKGVTRVESGVMSSGSFIGFAGVEDLGGGLKAGFALESFLAADTGEASGVSSGNINTKEYRRSGSFWNRTSHVYLSGSFGKLALGQYDSVLYTLLTDFSPLGDSQVFAPNQVMHYGSALLGSTNFGVSLGQGTSWVNAITYETPNVSGFKATVQFAPKENSDTYSENKNNIGLGVSYAAGPLAVSGIYTRTGDNDNGYFSHNVKTTGLAASYDFGVVKLSGIYTKSKPDYTDTWNTKFYQVGAAIPVSANGKVSTAYGQRKYDNGGGYTVKGKMVSVAYEHTLSKRTSVYVAAGNLKVTQNSVSDSGTNYAVGIKHSF